MRSLAPLRRLPVVAAALAGFTALAVLQAGTASADPSTSFVTVGSDTTQDVVNQFSADSFPGLIGSWDAVNPVTNAAHEVITPKAGCSMTRPNGSGEGLAALRKSINPATTATQLADAPEPGCIDFARSSSAAGQNAATNGDLLYIPFALDAVATATGPAAAVGGSDPAQATAITHANEFSLGTVAAPGDLIKLYRDCAQVTVGGVTYDPNTPAAAGTTAIHLYVPQPGSGTRNFWGTTLNFNATTLPTCVHDHSVITPAQAVEEHDGSVFASDPAGFGPFSIAQFVAQTNGHHARLHNVALHNLAATPGGTAVAPTVGGALNTAYPIKREVYNIVKRSRVTAGSADFSTALSGLLVGAGSQLCSDRLTILGFGFATLNTSPLGHTCGATSNDLRAFDPTSNPV